MNDAMPDGGTQKVTDGMLKELAAELQRTATDKHIETDPRWHVVSDEAEANSKAQQRSDEYEGKVVPHPDGPIMVEVDGIAEKGYWPVKCKAWCDIYDSYADIRDRVEQFVEVDPYRMNLPMEYMEKVTSALDQGADLNVEKVKEVEEEKEENKKSIDPEELRKYIEAGSDWELVEAVSENLSDWSGRAIQVFRLAYLEQLPTILLGQYILAKALAESLEIAKTTFTGIRQDCANITQAAIDALESGTEGSWGVDVDTAESLAVISQITALAGTGAAFIPHPGAQAFSKVAAAASSGAALASTIIKKADLPKVGSEGSKIQLEGNSVGEIISSVASEFDRSWKYLDEIENTAASTLDEFYAMAIDTSEATTVYPDRDDNPSVGVPLTVRETFFEPKAPAAEKGYGPGLGTIGEQLTDEDSNNDPGYETVRDSGVMGAPIASGATFGGDLETLWHAGNTHLPQLAEQYSDIAGDIDSASAGVENAFSREVLIMGGADQGLGTGPLYPAWVQLHNELLNICKGSATNLNSVGVTLCMATEAFAAQDEEAGNELRDRMEEELPF